MGNKKDILQYDLEAIKQVLNAIAAATNRWRLHSFEVTDFGLCKHKFKIIIREIRYCGWKNSVDMGALWLVRLNMFPVHSVCWYYIFSRDFNCFT